MPKETTRTTLRSDRTLSASAPELFSPGVPRRRFSGPTTDDGHLSRGKAAAASISSRFFGGKFSRISSWPICRRYAALAITCASRVSGLSGDSRITAVLIFLFLCFSLSLSLSLSVFFFLRPMNGVQRKIFLSEADPLLSGSRWNFQFCAAAPLYVIVRRRGERTYRAVSSRRRRRRAVITATPLKMAFIKAILPSDRCRAKEKSESRCRRRWGPLPLADPLRMIITSRRLNFALHPPYRIPSSLPRKGFNGELHPPIAIYPIVLPCSLLSPSPTPALPGLF